MQLSPYLSSNGQCEAAFKFYEQCLGGKVVSMITNGKTPMAQHTPPERHNAIVHVRMVIGDTVLMGGDAPPEYYQTPAGFSVSLVIESAAEAERAASAWSSIASAHPG